jgi:hypothetical protein
MHLTFAEQKMLAGLGMLAVWLTLSIGCGAIRPNLSKPPWPQPGSRRAEAMSHPKTTEPGVWEPAWSEANGVKYTLELEKRNKECDLIIDALGR